MMTLLLHQKTVKSLESKLNKKQETKININPPVVLILIVTMAMKVRKKKPNKSYLNKNKHLPKLQI